MERQRHDKEYFKALAFIICIFLLLMHLADGCINKADAATVCTGAHQFSSIADGDGHVYSGRISDAGEFMHLADASGQPIARAARYNTVEGYCFRSNYQYARLAIIRAILPESTGNIGQLRRQLYIDGQAYWQASAELKEMQKSQYTSDAEISSKRQEIAAISKRITKNEAAIYAAMPSLLARVKSGAADAELLAHMRVNATKSGTDAKSTARTFAQRIISGAMASVVKSGDVYAPSYAKDSEPH